MRFDEQAYHDEMVVLLFAAIQRMNSEHEGTEIYTINIWTDPNAARSAVNIDSFANSVAKVEQQNAWSKKHYDRLIAKGEFEEARLFQPTGGRLCNPADFAFREIATIKNVSFDESWEEESAGKCWDALEPALLRLGQVARQVFSALKLHPEAELSVNSRRDWYDHSWSMRG